MDVNSRTKARTDVRKKATATALGLVSLLLALTIGCQSTNPSMELLESELRAQEDQIYYLDREVGRLSSQLASARRNNDSLRQQLSRPSREADSSDSSRPLIERTPRSATPSGSGSGRPSPPPAIVPVPDPSELEEEDLQVPRIDLGTEAADAAGPEGSAAPAAGDSQDASPPGNRETRNRYQNKDRTVDVEVARVVLNSRLTGGLDADDQAGDEALSIVVEPQNAAGEYLPLPGDLTIEVIDPKTKGSNTELARWDFDASETLPLMKKTLLGRGVHLNLPWPNQPPQSETLQLLVRYRTAMGKELIAKREVRVDLMPSHYPVDSRAETIAARESRGTSLADPFVPPAAASAQDLLPSQTTVAPRAPRPPSSTTPSWEPQRIPEMAEDRSNVATVPTAKPLRSDRGTPSAPGRLQWKPYR